jgi:hypothetical protein
MDTSQCERSGIRYAADSVRIAARVTMRAAGVRLWGETTGVIPPAEEPQVLRTRTGVADIAGLRTDVTETVGPASLESVGHLVVTLKEHLPWLLTDDEVDALQPRRTVSTRHVFIGGEQFETHPYHGDFYLHDGDRSSRRRNTDDPLWIVEALQWPDDVTASGSGEVRDEVCQKFSFHVDLERHRGMLELPRQWGPVGAPHLRGEVWIDEQNRIRRVTWTEIRRRRPRFDPGPDSAERITLELWDFGNPVSIEIPELERPEISRVQQAKVLLYGARMLRQRKREHERRQQPTERSARPSSDGVV